VLISFTLKSPLPDDKDFIIKASQANMAEIEAGNIASEKASTDSVKTYARMMVSDHTTAQNELESIAKARNVTLPTSTDAEHKALAAKLTNMSSGTQFDKAYMESQLKDHRKAVALFQQEAQSGTGDVKAYAAKYLPKLRMHLQMAQNSGKQGMHSGMNSANLKSGDSARQSKHMGTNGQPDSTRR